MGLTVTPPRVGKCRPVLESLAGQTLPGLRVMVSVPPAYRRFPEATVEVPTDWANLPRLTVHRCQKDYGPLTKLLGPLEVVPDDALVVVADDDTVYGARAVEGLLRKLLRHPDCCWAGAGVRIGPYLRGEPARLIDGMEVDLAEGFALRLHQPRWFRTPDFENYLDQVGELLFGDDDLLVSNYLRGMGVTMRVGYDMIYNRDSSLRQLGYGFGPDALHQVGGANGFREIRSGLLRSLRAARLCHLPFPEDES